MPRKPSPTPEASSASAAPASAGRGRARGRPATLSHQAIIDCALLTLERHEADDLSMADIAHGLGVSTMSLYKYFPNREALLAAVADHAFSFLALPEAGDDWRAYLRDWLAAVQQHADRYPVVRKVMGWEGRVPTAWIAVCAPVLVLLRDQGLTGDDLAFAHNWFLSSATGLMMVEAVAPTYRSSVTLGQLDQLPREAQEVYLSVLPALPKVDRQAILAFGFDQLVAGVEILLRRTTGRTARAARR